MRLLNLTFCLFTVFFSFSQRAKNGDTTIANSSVILNTYTFLTANASAGATSITVNSNTLIGAAFTTNLAQGDLIMIYQMYGAQVDFDGGTYSTTYPFTYPIGYISGWKDVPFLWGQILQYNSAGKYELVEVLSVSGSNTITLNCALTNAYDFTKKVQIIRVPRYNNLIVNTGNEITCPAWDGQIGGVVALEVNGNLTLNGTAKINVKGKGFRGGVADNTGISEPATADNINGSSFLSSNNDDFGGRKGESIAGYTPEYTTNFMLYGRGAPANGGGGGGNFNSGGGGGSNVGPTANYTGRGVPSTTYNTAWEKEYVGFAGSSSPGGGRGGYSLSSQNLDALTVGPNVATWNGNGRKVNGGLGGHPLTYDAQRLFFGGGGGAGDQDNTQAGAGGNGGGLIFLQVNGNFTGSGTLDASGTNGINSNPLNQSPSIGQKKGNDGAGGGGAGGSIAIKNANPIASTINLVSTGGAGGNNNVTVSGASMEAHGPGGGGSGGFVSYSSGTPALSIAGGANGTTNSTHLTEFPPNGATIGAVGFQTSQSYFNLLPNGATICSSSSATISVTVVGVAPGTITWYTQQYGGSSIATGTSYTTPVLTTTTTYWVGVCPGTFRIPVTVVIGSTPLISGTAVITNATCSTLGSISGLSVSGGAAPLTYSWNGTVSPTLNISNLTAGNYTLVVTDAAGCSATSSVYTVNGVGGPTVNSSSITIQNELCNGTLGSISGITASGVGLIYSWTNSGGSSINAVNLPQGSYTLTVTDQNGCIANAGPFTVGYTSGPSVDVTGVSIVNPTCLLNTGSITGITATGSGLTYSWNGTNTPSADLNSATANSYTLVVTDGNGCTVNAGPYVISNPSLPVIDISNLNIIQPTCGNSNGQISGITVSGGAPNYSYSWTGTAQTTLNLTNLSAVTYTLTVTDQNGCTDNQVISVTPLNGPSINETNVQVNQISCNGTLGSISGLTVSGNGLNYAWSNGANTLDISNLSAGTYTLVVTDINSCIVTSSPFQIQPYTGVSIDTTFLVKTKENCNLSNGSIAGISVSGGTPAYTYVWNNNPTLNTLNLSAIPSGNYNLVVTDQTGCTANVNLVLGENSGSTIDATNLQVTQPTCNVLGAISGLQVNGNGGYSYNWSPGNLTTLNISNLLSGTYNLSVTDALGCIVNYGPITLNQPIGPNADFSVNPIDPDVNELVVFNSTSSGNIATYEWLIEGQTLSTNQISYTYTQEGQYSVTLIVVDANNCSDTITKTILVYDELEVPNVITANNDLVNDFFEIKGLKPNTSLFIINRWGEVVFESSNYLNNWNGKDKSGKNLSEGVYFYKLVTQSGEKKEGFLHIK